jgi:hypothetical protein
VRRWRESSDEEQGIWRPTAACLQGDMNKKYSPYPSACQHENHAV